MSLYAISDPHLSLGTDKPMDIFKGWADYVSRLEANWRAVVSEEDTVVLPGDISWALKLEETQADFAFLHSLPGKKLIGKGNHDLWWSTVTKMKRFLSNNGFTSIDFLFNNAFPVGGMAVCGTRGWFFDDLPDKKVLLREVGRLNASISAAEALELEPVVFLHYPPIYADSVCEEIFSVLKERGIRRCYYGHIHGAGAYNAVKGPVDGIEFHLISCDHLEFCPKLVSL